MKEVAALTLRHQIYQSGTSDDYRRIDPFIDLSVRIATDTVCLYLSRRHFFDISLAARQMAIEQRDTFHLSANGITTFWTDAALCS